MRGVKIGLFIVGLLALSALITPVRAADAPAVDGIQLYGNVDVGVAYQSAGGKESDYYATGIFATVQKFDYQSQFVLNGNNWSQSRIGLRGQEPIADGLNAVFQLETLFNPFSGQISDSLKALTINNGVAANQQTSAGDSSVAGQFFNGAAVVGIQSTQAGSLTFGRQKGVLADGIDAYDPLLSSQGFSPIGGPGTAAGGGDTENRRLDGSVKYEVRVDGVHVAAQYQPKSGSKPAPSQAYALGYALGGFKVDGYLAINHDAIAAAALSASAVTTVNKVCAGTAVANYACDPINKALAGTISDNTAFALMSQYTTVDHRNVVSAAVEQIQYRNPSQPVSAGQVILNSYLLASVNNTAVPSEKQLTIAWIGNKHSFGPRDDLYAAFYRYHQNQYATAAATQAGCAANSYSNSLCAGIENFVSIAYVHHYGAHLDGYAGAIWSQVQGGLANGFTAATSSGVSNATSTINPTLGVNYKF